MWSGCTSGRGTPEEAGPSAPSRSGGAGSCSSPILCRRASRRCSTRSGSTCGRLLPMQNSIWPRGGAVPGQRGRTLPGGAFCLRGEKREVSVRRTNHFFITIIRRVSEEVWLTRLWSPREVSLSAWWRRCSRPAFSRIWKRNQTPPSQSSPARGTRWHTGTSCCFPWSLSSAQRYSRILTYNWTKESHSQNTLTIRSERKLCSRTFPWEFHHYFNHQWLLSSI